MSTRNIEVVANCLHKDLRRVTYPRSLGVPDFNKEEWLQEVRDLFYAWAEDSKASYIGC